MGAAWVRKCAVFDLPIEAVEVPLMLTIQSLLFSLLLQEFLDCAARESVTQPTLRLHLLRKLHRS